MSCKKLFETIDRLNGKYISFWENICNIESPSEYKEGLDAVGKCFVDMAKILGFETEIFTQEKAGNVVCITMNPDSAEKPITLSAHIDTVHPRGSFGNPAVRIDGDNIYGPGVMDCKGGAAAAFMAMEALAECGFSDRPVRLLLQTDEETNSILSDKQNIEYICRKASDSVAFLNCEGYTPGTAVLARKGIMRYRFTVTGKSAHASRCNAGASAVLEAAHKIIELEKFKDDDGITCNCGIINGGTASNTVPDKCEFQVDVRFSDAAQCEHIKNRIEAIAGICTVEGCSCKAELESERPAMEPSEKNDRLLERINDIFAANGLETLEKRKSPGGSDAAEITVAGIPCVDSVGVEGDFIHTVKEYARISSLSGAAKRLASFINCWEDL